MCNRSFHSNSPSATKIPCWSFCINSADWLIGLWLRPQQRLRCCQNRPALLLEQNLDLQVPAGMLWQWFSLLQHTVSVSQLWMSISTYELPSPRTGLVLLCSLTLIWVSSTELLHLLHNVSNQLFMEMWWLQTVFNLSMKVKRWENKVTE